jgi:hypothetical protein
MYIAVNLFVIELFPSIVFSALSNPLRLALIYDVFKFYNIFPARDIVASFFDAENLIGFSRGS